MCDSISRSPNDGSPDADWCTGTDLNRNWGYHWNEGGSSDNTCSDAYHGPSAFSEVEDCNVRDFLLKNNGTIKFYNNMHSYSQMILLPWGYTETQMPNYDRNLEIANTVYPLPF